MRCLVLWFTGFKENPQKDLQKEPFTSIASNGYVRYKKFPSNVCKNFQLFFLIKKGSAFRYGNNGIVIA